MRSDQAHNIRKFVSSFDWATCTEQTVTEAQTGKYLKAGLPGGVADSTQSNSCC